MSERAGGWVRHLKSIREPAMRRAAMGERLAAEPPSIVVGSITELIASSGGRSVAVDLTVDTFATVLDSDEAVGYKLRRDLHSAWSKHASARLARLLLQVSPPVEGVDHETATGATRTVVPGGRPLSLGERKSLARTHDRQMLAHVLRDPHPDVMAILIDNPNLTEVDAVTLAARRPTLPESQITIASSDRWSTRYRVKCALVKNPFTPIPLALRRMLTLRDKDLLSVQRDANLAPTVRANAEEVLRLRRG